VLRANADPRCSRRDKGGLVAPTSALFDPRELRASAAATEETARCARLLFAPRVGERRNLVLL
jgi:hypothetical protein